MLDQITPSRWRDKSGLNWPILLCVVFLLAAIFGAAHFAQTLQAQGSKGQPFPLSQNFNTDDCGVADGWRVISADADADNTWTCSAAESYAEANGFGNDAPAEEWLISPPLNMDAQTSERLTFSNYTHFTDRGYPQLSIHYSTDYAGGDPADATWLLLNGANFSSADSDEWVDSGALDLSWIDGENVHFAFTYASTGTTWGKATLWRIDAIEFSAFSFVTSEPASTTISLVTRSPIITSTATLTPTATLLPTATPLPALSFPLTQSFDDDACGATDGWQVISADADQANTWSCSAQFSNADVNGFGADAPADDWLISPALNMDAHENEQLTFRNYTNFTDSNYPQLVVLYSTNYSGDLAAATWTALGGITFSAEGSDEWIDSGTVDLSTIGGSSIHFAFRYTSSGTSAGSAANWRIDDVAFTAADASTTTTPISTPTTSTPVASVSATPTSALGTLAPPADTVQIHAVQGGNAATEREGDVVSVEAIVVGDFQAADQLSGFFIQEEDDEIDGFISTSEGIFVYCDACPADVAIGDLVRVTGAVAEFNGMTQIVSLQASDITVVSSGNPLPSAAEISLSFNTRSTEDEEAFEPVEGMLVTFRDELFVSEYFELARFGQLVLTADERPRQFTDQFDPGIVAYAEYLADLNSDRIILDDDSSKQNAPTAGDEDKPYYWPRGSDDPKGLSTTNYIRGGDSIEGLTGVLQWAFDAWRVRPVDEAFSYEFTSNNPRQETAPACLPNNLKVASFNVLNYFTTLGERGAESTVELDRQREKIASAICEIDADVVGLIEIENNGSTALDDLLNGTNGVNAQCGDYDFVDADMIGTDEIAVGFIFKGETMSPVGDPAILDSSVDARFLDTKNRPALAQTFINANDSGFTAVINHLKSKGADCVELGDPDLSDGAANCNLTRTNAAAALVDWLDTDPTGSGISNVLVMGDLNAYRNETPINAIRDGADDTPNTADDYVDLLDLFEHDDAYTYLFDGQRGYLDYILASQTLRSQVMEATAWHINADEIPLFDYNDGVQDPGEASFRRESTALPIYEPNAFRASDHDPVIACLDLAFSPSAFVYLPAIFSTE